MEPEKAEKAPDVFDLDDDSSSSIDTIVDFDAPPPIPYIQDAHKCEPNCTHCEVCFDLDYNLLSRNGPYRGERQIHTSLSNVDSAGQNGCHLCSVLSKGVRLALSEETTGEALEIAREADVRIQVLPGYSINLCFDQLLELEYYSLEGMITSGGPNTC